jgi:uncharacterized membrane protein
MSSSTIALYGFQPEAAASGYVQSRRLNSIDLVRGGVMVIMALDHVRHFFHQDAFLYEPTDLAHTNVLLFFTRWITHFCAPVFVFLAGISAYLYGVNKSRNDLAYYLFSRGVWLVFAELFIIGLGQTFNPAYPFYNLQVIWAIGISMIVLSVLIYLKRQYLLILALLLIGGHNFLDGLHVTGNGARAFFWAMLHEPGKFQIGHLTIYVMYPVLPWIGIMAVGYYLGYLFSVHFSPEKRIRVLVILGFSAIALFYFLRVFNIYGDPAPWTAHHSIGFSFLSLLNVTKYPPSLLYILVTLGPALITLAIAEGPLNAVTEKLVVFGRVPFFYYVVHIYLIHILALGAAVISGFHWTDMILHTRLNMTPGLKGYGFNLLTVYLVWIFLIVILYPCCKWYYSYKRARLSTRWWLSYI